jgi:hypothetical protein
MHSVEDKVITRLLANIKAACPQAYDFIGFEITNLKKDHQYYWRIHNSVKCAFESQLLPQTFKALVTELNQAIAIINKRELIGFWKGKADGTEEDITFQIREDATTSIIREWEDEDGEIKQVYDSFSDKYLECSDLIVCDLWNKQRITNIKMAVHPIITHTKTMMGTMYMFQERTMMFCMRVQLEYVPVDCLPGEL